MDYINTLGLTKELLESYDQLHSSKFPGTNTRYDNILIGTHSFLNDNVHNTVQNRAELVDEGVYLTDHGPKHIEIVMKRASELVRCEKSMRSIGTSDDFYKTCLTPYEIFLLCMAIHFHDVGNMYGRDGHEQRILEEMQKIGTLTIQHHEKAMISRIAACHGGRINGSKDTIRSLLTAGWDHDGPASYRPQCLAAVLRFADELADEHSRADNYGLMEPGKLPPKCLLYHKYAQALRVGIDALSGFISLKFNLYADDLKSPFEKVGKDKKIVKQYLLDEIYERTLKTYTEMVYCDRYMRDLHARLHEVRVEIDIYPHHKTSTPQAQFYYAIGDTDYPEYAGNESHALEELAREFSALPNGADFAKKLKQPQIESKL